MVDECHMRCDREATHMAFYGGNIEGRGVSEVLELKKPVCPYHREYEKAHAQEDVVFQRLEEVAEHTLPENLSEETKVVVFVSERVAQYFFNPSSVGRNSEGKPYVEFQRGQKCVLCEGKKAYFNPAVHTDSYCIEHLKKEEGNLCVVEVAE